MAQQQHANIFRQSGSGLSPPFENTTDCLRTDCDFKNRADTALFYWSPDVQSWTRIGKPLKMVYSLDHFIGYRYGLFNYATKNPGGYADFDYFHISTEIAPAKQ